MKRSWKINLNSIAVAIIALLASGFYGYAQITVSTITPQFKGSGGLCLDQTGNLYIADFGDFLGVPDTDGLPNVISKLDAEMVLSEYSTNFVRASGNAFDGNEVLHQADIGVSAIYKVIGGVRTFFTSTGISNPVGLAFDNNDNLYVCNCGNNTIRKVTPAGVSTLFAAGNLFSCPNGLTIDEDQNLYVSNFSNGNIIKVTSTGISTLINVTPTGTTSGPSNGHLDYHQPSRTLFIASMAASTIYYIDLDDSSNLVTLAGTGVRGNTDGDASAATFSRPNGVAVTQSGDSIYINSAIPLTNVPNTPLNPSIVRLITGVQSVLSTNTNSLPNYSVKAYPNPVKDSFSIEADLLQDYSHLRLEIYDIQGRIVHTIKDLLTENSRFGITLDIGHFESGNYFYTLFEKAKQLFNGRLIKN